MDMNADNGLTAISEIPSIEEIQQTLVNINDKPESFLNSTDWLGALEVKVVYFVSKSFNWLMDFAFDFLQVFYVIDTLYDISCRIQHIPSCHDIRKYSNIIKFYLENFGGPIMMGGDLDASSKCIVGIHIAQNDAYLLIVVSIFVLLFTSEPKKCVIFVNLQPFCCCTLLFSFALIVHFLIDFVRVRS